MAKTMVAMEHTMDHLKLLGQNGWQNLETHPDLVAAHEALMLREHFAELLRTGVVASEDGAFVRLMRESEADSLQLERLLRDTTLPSEDRSASAHPGESVGGGVLVAWGTAETQLPANRREDVAGSAEAAAVDWADA